MGIFNDEWENEVYRLKAQIRELERENKLLREALIKERERNRKLKDQLYECQNNRWLNPDQFQHFQ